VGEASCLHLIPQRRVRVRVSSRREEEVPALPTTGSVHVPSGCLPASCRLSPHRRHLAMRSVMPHRSHCAVSSGPSRRPASGSHPGCRPQALPRLPLDGVARVGADPWSEQVVDAVSRVVSPALSSPYRFDHNLTFRIAVSPFTPTHVWRLSGLVVE
jgi:hypothetical protein